MVKNAFSILNSSSNPLWGAMLEVNEATSGGLGYSFIILIFIVSSFVVIRRTQDIGKSLATGLHITTMLTLILYYAGKVEGFIFINDVTMLGLVVAEVLTIGGLYYFRTNKE